MTNKDSGSKEFFGSGSKGQFKEVAELLDKLEGAIELEKDSDVCEIFKDREGLEGKNHDNLRQNLRYLEESRVSEEERRKCVTKWKKESYGYG